MSRLAPLDMALVLIMVPLWVVCFTLALQAQVESLADRESYPTLTGKFLALFYPDLALHWRR